MLWLLLSCAPEPTTPAPEAVPAPDGAPQADYTTEPVSVDYEVDASDPASRALRITATLRGVDPRGFYLKRTGGDAVPIRDVQLRTLDGTQIPLEAHRKRWNPPAGTGGDLVVSWMAEPGGQGRHGHQGYIADDFAVFDGRVWIVPSSRNPIGTVRMRFDMPEGWRVASALRDAGDGWWHVDAPASPMFLVPRLFSECIGLGPFEATVEPLGQTELRVWTHPRIEPSVAHKIVADTLGEGRWFHETLGFDPEVPLSFVRTPSADPIAGVPLIFGGASLSGACWEDTHFERPVRNELLLGHRFGHPYNRYLPTGLGLRDPQDRWFSEGWASYVEVIAAEASGAMPDQGYFTTLFHQHLDRLHDAPDWDLAMVDEHTVEGEAVEYVHYIRAPLAVRLLAHLVEERTDTTLEAVMKAVTAEHGGHRGVWSLPEALREHTGERFSDFFEGVVWRPGAVAPVWPGYVDAVTLEAVEPPAGWAGNTPISGAYLRYLASTPDFTRYQDIASFVAEEPSNRRALAQAGVTLAHADVLAAADRLPHAVRYALAKAEAGWPIERAGGKRPRVVPALRLDRDHPDGAAFFALLESEARYEASLGRSGLRALEVHPGVDSDHAEQLGPRLVFNHDERITLYAHWHGHPALTAFAATSGDDPPFVKEVVVEPGWKRTRVEFLGDDRPDGAVLTLSVGPPGGPVLQRAFWQRQRTPERPEAVDPSPAAP